MDLDRATQSFLIRFPDSVRREAELLRQRGAVKQIFGGSAFVQARVEDGADVYRVTLRKEKHGWESDVRGPEHNPVAVCAAMLERIERGEKLPESPNEVENLTLTALLEEKLGRELLPEEDRFVEKLEKRYKKYTLEECLTDHDLVRLAPRWPVESLDPITLWPTPPANIVEFWNYIAAAFDKKKIKYPAFLSAITDKAATQEKIQDWEEQRELEIWEGRFQQVLAAPQFAPKAVALRLRVTTREARMQKSVDGAEFENVASDPDMLAIQEGVGQGHLKLDELSAHLLTLWATHWQTGEPPSCAVRLENPGATSLLGRIFRQQALAERVVTLDDTPFHRATQPLRWVSLEESAESEEAPQPLKNGAKPFVLKLLMPDGEPVPYNLVVLPGVDTLYLSDDAVFPGPPCWTEGVEVQPRTEIPRKVIESEAGLEFLRRLGSEPPPSLQALVEPVELHPKIAVKLLKRGANSETEIVHAEITASDAEGCRLELFDRDQWKVVERKPLPSGKIPLVMRTKLQGLNEAVENLGLSWDAGQKCFRGRMNKSFPEKFATWLRKLPPDVEITLDQDLTSLRKDPIQAAVRFELAESKEIDWFDLKILVDVNEKELTRQQIRDLVEARGGFVRMADGTWMRLSLSLTEQQEAAITRLGLDLYDLSGETHKMHALQLADPGAKEIFDERAWEKICRRADQLKLHVRPAVPQGVPLTLRPYQIEGYHFLAYLAVNRFGGLLADDMGLGKTAQSLTWILWLRQTWLAEARKAQANSDLTVSDPVPPPALVVAPKSVLDVWANECKKFAPELRVQVIRNKEDLDVGQVERAVDLLVMNYSQLRVNIEKLKPVKWLAAILDEGQQVKNPDSMAARAARDLQADHRLVLTGTPIENRLLDVWSLMAFAMPGVLGNRKYFKDRFDRRKDPDAHIRLSARLRPFILRRTKGQVALDLPPRTEEEVFCKMEEIQEELYNAELLRMQRVLLGFDSDSALRKNSFAVLQGLMRLRQICCHPGLIDPKHDDATSAKMTALFYLLDQLRDEGHKVLVFSQFVTMLEIIQKRLEEEDRPHVILTGQTKDRGQVVEKFQTSKDPTVFLLSLKAGGSGLNLTAASYVVLYDPWWNPAVENQAIDRTHRIGQLNPVIAYRLLIRNSVEEKIRKLQQQKQMLFTGVLGEESFASNLGLDDVKFLFSRESE